MLLILLLLALFVVFGGVAFSPWLFLLLIVLALVALGNYPRY